MKETNSPARFVFNTIGLFTRDNKATVEFYTKVFGFTTEWDGIQPNVEMTLGNMRIILFPREAFEQMVSRSSCIPKASMALWNWHSTCRLSLMWTKNIRMPSTMGRHPSFLPPRSHGDSAPAMWQTLTAT